MDRIDELLVRLIDEQDTATFHQCMRAPNRFVADLDRSKALIRRDALRDEIAADWRAMVEALEEGLDLLYGLTQWIPNDEQEILERMHTTLARVKENDA